MAFTFDSTVGGANANSYVSVSDADDYFTAHLEGSFWTALTAGQKQAALVQATNRIDMEQFGGQRTNQNTQRLAFPRAYIVSRDFNTNNTNVVDFNGVYFRDMNTIPKEIVDATCEQALYYVKQSAGEFSVDDNDLETLSKFKLGPMDFTIKDGIKADRLPSKVKQLLKATGPNAWSSGDTLQYYR